MNEPKLTDAEFKRAREICEKATPGPWVSWKKRHNHGIDTKFPGNTGREGDYDLVFQDDHCSYESNDMEFISESRTLLPKALSEIERLNDRIEELEDELRVKEIHCGCRHCGVKRS